ncbi:MAG: hypothetical protein JOZ58_13265 [Acetobacteraceae bacterium]|nr:hypothetical protein [Acetobacteraceae bacterium]
MPQRNDAKRRSAQTNEAEPASDRHERARELAEQALEEYAKGDKKKGDQLAEEAARIDRSAVEEVVQELDEDAGSNPDAVNRSG